MATRKATIDHLLATLGHPDRFSVRAMFSEYALYADGKVVALVCDDLLHVRIMPASGELEALCEKGAPFPGAKPHYVVAEEQLSSLRALPGILTALAASLPMPKKKVPRGRQSGTRTGGDKA